MTPTRSKARVGQVFPGATVTGLRGTAVTGHFMVEAKCSRCPTVYDVRYTYLASGRQLSCGCHGKKMFRQMQERRVEELTPDRRLELFIAAQMFPMSLAVAQTGVDKYLLDFNWRAECRRLADLPQEMLDQIVDMAQQRPTYEVATYFKMTFAEVLRICHHRKIEVKHQEEDLHALAESTEADPLKAARLSEACCLDWMFRDDLVRKVRAAIRIGLDLTVDEDGNFRHFLSKELGTPTRGGSFDWVRDHLASLDRRAISSHFGDEGVTFLSLCKRTTAARSAARLRAIEKANAGTLGPKRKRRWAGDAAPSAARLRPVMHPAVLNLTVRRHTEPAYRPKDFTPPVSAPSNSH